jgi:beta-phosphoglucomutase-like phosphatase (HAD superfamily)
MGGKKLEAVFFDMDGVLVFSEPAHFSAWKEALEETAGGVPEWFKYETIHGVADSKIAVLLGERIPAGADPYAVLERKKEIFLTRTVIPPEYPAGRDSFIKWTKDAGLKRALVSSSSRAEVEKILRSQGLENDFEIRVTMEDVKNQKPDPEPYLKALAAADVSPDAAAALEDSGAGVAAAERAGLTVLAVVPSGGIIPARSPSTVIVPDFNAARKYLSSEVISKVGLRKHG